MDELRRHIQQTVLGLVQSSFDTPSQTHIFYHRGPGPVVKGFGDWSNEAFDRFSEHLTSAVNGADEAALRRWDAALSNRERVVQRASACSGSIGMITSTTLYDSLALLARERNVSTSALVEAFVAVGLDKLESRILREPTRKLAEEVKQASEADLKAERRKDWVLRLDSALHARAMLLAEDLSIPQTDVCRGLLLSALESADYANVVTLGRRRRRATPLTVRDRGTKAASGKAAAAASRPSEAPPMAARRTTLDR